MGYQDRHGIQVADEVVAFIETRALPGSGVTENDDVVGQTERVEVVFLQHQLDAERRVADGEFEFNETVQPLFADAHIAPRGIEVRLI